MTATMYLQVIVNGLVSGLIYALTAAGFSLIYGQGRIVFFALGEIYMIAAVCAYLLIVVLGLPYFVALVLIVIGLGGVGILVERFLFRHISGNELNYAFASLALGMLLSGVMLWVFGERFEAIPEPFPGILNVFGVVVTINKIVVIVISLSVLTGLQAFFQRSRYGRAIRAAAQDVDAAQLVGVDLNHITGMTFFLALGVTATAGVLVAPLYYVDVFMGGPILMTTLIVVVLGGLGSFGGAIIGGLFIGLLESIGYTFFGGITTLLSFGVVIVLLIIKPLGLFGRE